MEWITIAIVGFIGWVLANIFHDLGHFVSAKLLKANGIILEIGKGQKVFSKGSISLHRNVLVTGRILCRKFAPRDQWKRLVLYAGGIFGNMFGYLVLSILAGVIPWVITGVNVFNVLAIVFTAHMLYDAIPHQLGGRKTDGKRMFDMVKEARQMMKR